MWALLRGFQSAAPSPLGSHLPLHLQPAVSTTHVPGPQVSHMGQGFQVRTSQRPSVCVQDHTATGSNVMWVYGVRPYLNTRGMN